MAVSALQSASGRSERRRTYSSSPVIDGKDEEDGGEVDGSEDVLRPPDVPTVVGQLVEDAVQAQKSSGVPEDGRQHDTSGIRADTHTNGPVEPSSLEYRRSPAR